MDRSLEDVLANPALNPIDCVNEYLSGIDAKETEQVLAGILESLAPIEKIHETVIEEGIKEITSNMTGIWNKMEDLKRNVEELHRESVTQEPQAPAQLESRHLIDQMGQVSREKKRLREIGEALDSKLSLHSQKYFSLMSL